MCCNKPGKKVGGEKEFAFHGAGHVPNFSHVPNFPKLLKICKHVLSKPKCRQVDRGKKKINLRVTCKAFDWTRMLFPFGYMPVSRERATPTSSHWKSWVSSNFTFRPRDLGEKDVHTQRSHQALVFNHFFYLVFGLSAASIQVQSQH